MSQPIRGRCQSWFSDRPEKKNHKLGRRRCDLASCQISLNSVQQFQRSKNGSTNQRPGGHFCILIGPENTNLVEEVEILLQIMFRWIPSAVSEKNSKRGRVGILRPEKQTWKRRLRSCFMSRFVKIRSAVSKEKSKMAQSIRGRAAILVFRSDRKHKVGKRRWGLASCQVPW